MEPKDGYMNRQNKIKSKDSVVRKRHVHYAPLCFRLHEWPWLLCKLRVITMEIVIYADIMVMLLCYILQRYDKLYDKHGGPCQLVI